MQAAVADITKLKGIEVIVNAANGRGPMGHGVAGAIGAAGGPQLRNEVRRICVDAGGFKDGDCYISSPGDLEKLGMTAIYHAVTMEYPGSRTSLDTVAKAMRSTLDRAIANGVKSIAFPGLGTGVGALDPKSVASLMVRVAKTYSDKITISIVDVDVDFIGYCQQAIQQAIQGDGNEQQTRQDGVSS